MKDRPIIFSGEMVRAILEGRKTQTRCVIRPQLIEEVTHPGWYSWKGQNGWRPQDLAVHCPYSVPGDRLWVRETWRIMSMPEDPIRFQYKADMAVDEERDYEDCGWAYRRYERWYERQAQKVQEDCDKAGLPNDEDAPGYNWTIETCPTRWQPSIHMPKFAARIQLEVVSVRVERLQEISEVDAQAEGITEDNLFGLAYSPKYQSLTDERYTDLDPGVLLRGPVGNYAMLWDDLNAKRGYSYITNPWVFVISFSRSSEVNHSQK